MMGSGLFSQQTTKEPTFNVHKRWAIVELKIAKKPGGGDMSRKEQVRLKIKYNTN